MKIQGSNIINSTNPYNRNQHKDNLTTDKSNRKDQLSISSEAMAMLDELSGKQHAERSQKVEELKHQVQSGTYQVEAGKVAEKLLEWWK